MSAMPAISLPTTPNSTAMAPHTSSPSLSSPSGATTSVQVGELLFLTLSVPRTHPPQHCAYGPRHLQTWRRFPLAFREPSFTQYRPQLSLSMLSLLRLLPPVLLPRSLALPRQGKNKCLLSTKSIPPIPHSMRSLRPPLNLSFRAFSKALIVLFSPMAKLVAARPLL